MKGKLLTKVCSWMLAISMLAGAGVATTIGLSSDNSVTVSAALASNYIPFFKNSTSYTQIKNGNIAYINSKNINKIKLYVTGNFKASSVKGSNLSYYGNAKYTYNAQNNRTYIVISLKPKEGKNSTLKFNGTVTNKGKVSNFGFSVQCKLDFTESATIGKGFECGRADFLGCEFGLNDNYVTAIYSTDQSVVKITDSKISGSTSWNTAPVWYHMKALKTGNASIKIKYNCGVIETKNFKVVEGKEYKSTQILSSANNYTFNNTASKDIYEIQVKDDNVVEARKTDGKRKYTITAKFGTTKNKTDVYIWYTDGSHSRITVSIKA